MAESPSKHSLNRQFLDAFLISAITGSLITLVLNYLIRNLPLLIFVNCSISLGLLLSYIILKVSGNITLSIFLATVITLSSIVFWFFSSSGYYGGATITVIMLLGYIYSLILSRPIRTYAHISVFCLLVLLLVYQYFHVDHFRYVTNPTSLHILATGVAFLILYLIIIISSSVLRDKYEKVNEELNVLNTHLEGQVEKRTRSLKLKTDQLEQYSFKNAHEVRASHARILGLLSLRNIDTNLTDNDLLELISKEANEMDIILKQISKDLYNSH